MSEVVLVGCGNMGFAMLEGWVKLGDGSGFHVVEPNEALRARAGAAGAKVYECADDLPSKFSPDLIFLAVKPQVMDQVVPDYARFGGATFVSIAAGTTLASLASWVGAETAIIRCMPNTPAAIGEGMLVSYANPHVTAPSKRAVDRLLATSGETGWVDDEALIDAVTAISGSGPAYVFHFIECLAEAGTKLGLDPDLSKTLALQTTAGAGLLARSSDTPPATLREQVTSPGGTTAAALQVLMGRLGPLLDEATTGARDRGRELGQG